MIIQITDDDSIILRCHTFDNTPEKQDFFIQIKQNHLFISRNGGELMKVYLNEASQLRPLAKSKKLKPLEKGIILIKLEKEK